ncbi:MAG: M20/M25/M40 family metallo-hydrolase [Pirellulaceae bacterium]
MTATLSRFAFAMAVCSTTVVWTLNCQAEDARQLASARLAADLQFLSADEQEGRDTGSAGIARAGEFIVKRFNDLKIETSLFDGQAYQEFTIPGPAALGDPQKNTLVLEGKLPEEGLPPLELGKTYTSLSLGSNGLFSGELVFAGYGISAPELGYDDYANLDVAGKVVIVLRKEPQQNQEDSKFDGTRSSQFAYFSTKEVNAALHKAAAMIMINDAQTAAGESGDFLLEVSGGGRALTNTQIPTMYATRSLVEPLIKQATGKTLEELEAAIDAEFKPQSQVLEGIIASGETFVEASQIPVRNVLGLLPGAGSLKDEFLVVGAHYDHVGMGGAGSLAPGTVAIHNGADDNASGTTTILEVAKRMAADTSENRRSIVFIAFTAEEKGLLGSKHYVRNPRFPLEDTVAMVNLDMVGRLSDNTLTVYGTGTSDHFDALIERHNQETQFTLDKQAAGLGPSDHSSFYEANIPVFHFFTGLHNDYHRPSDDFETVNIEGMSRIADMVTGVVKELSTQAERPNLIKTSAVAQVGRTMRGRNSAPRAVLGVQMDQSVAEAKIAEVNAAGPAAAAGLQAGDVITKIDDVSIDSFRTMRGVIRDKRPGEEIVLGIKRGDEALELTLTLGKGE